MAVPPNYTVGLPQMEPCDSFPDSTMVFVEQGRPAMPFYQASHPNLNICGWFPSPPSPLSVSNCWSPCTSFFGFVPTPAVTPYSSFYPSATMPSSLALWKSTPQFDYDSPTDVFDVANLQPEINLSVAPQLSISLIDTCCAVDSLLVPDEKARGSAGGNLPRLEPQAESMTSNSSPMEPISISEDVPHVARSRIAHACERCRIRKARFVCKFTSSRERGSKKSPALDLPTASQAADDHCRPAKLKIRRQSAHTPGQKHQVTILKSLPEHTAISLPDLPNMERPIDRHPKLKWAESESGPDVIHPTSALLPISNLTLADLAGFGLDSPTITPTACATFNSWTSDLQGENGLYTTMAELEMFPFAVIRTPPPLDDVDSMYHSPFTLFSPTIPDPLQHT
ncbi:hypothetical protein JCM24511_06156 [Saitozyma sp. JCM 24511]|nr:hypothetical protein JCM24511_06156 [Saitozyma sp. JCM 24511]